MPITMIMMIITMIIVRMLILMTLTTITITSCAFRVPRAALLRVGAGGGRII